MEILKRLLLDEQWKGLFIGAPVTIRGHSVVNNLWTNVFLWTEVMSWKKERLLYVSNIDTLMLAIIYSYPEYDDFLMATFRETWLH